MKKIILILFLSIGLIGCSAIDYSELSMPKNPIDTELERILALDLSYDDSIIEAKKNFNPDLVASVVKILNERKAKSDATILEAEIVNEYAEKIQISDNKLKFVASKISDTQNRSMMGDPDTFDYFLIGIKDNNDSSTNHIVNLSITYKSEEKRSYSSASFCDKWNTCDDENSVNINLISSKASGCSSTRCDYNEVVELDLTDEFLRKNMEKDLSIKFNSLASKSNKISFPSAYIKGYLKIVN